MNNIALKACLILITLSVVGCAGKTTPKTEPVQTSSLRVVVAELECRSANRLGCRHKGYIYPWNAWAELKGYKSADYTVEEVLMSGNQATVVVAKR
jgi:hypothetical protein